MSSSIMHHFKKYFHLIGTKDNHLVCSWCYEDKNKIVMMVKTSEYFNAIFYCCPDCNTRNSLENLIRFRREDAWTSFMVIYLIVGYISFFIFMFLPVFT